MENKNHIECSVTNCHYHKEGKICNAKTVKIAPSNANTTSDTGCETFKPEH